MNHKKSVFIENVEDHQCHHHHDNDFLGKKDCNFTMTLSTGLGDPGQIFPNVDN